MSLYNNVCSKLKESFKCCKSFSPRTYAMDVVSFTMLCDHGEWEKFKSHPSLPKSHD